MRGEHAIKEIVRFTLRYHDVLAAQWDDVPSCS
jgi:hypothetical protein